MKIKKSSKIKVAVFTGTRAEYGLLYWLMKDVASDPKLELQILATGTHLSSEFGLTYEKIESDGFQIDEKLTSGLIIYSPVSKVYHEFH